MANHTLGPWRHYHGKLRAQFPQLIHEIQDENGDAVIAWTGFDGLDLPKKEITANAYLIACAPSMLALLEKALPIIENEAQSRGASMIRHGEDQCVTPYWSEMRQLADEISAEINRAKGKEAKSDG